MVPWADGGGQEDLAPFVPNSASGKQLHFYLGIWFSCKILLGKKYFLENLKIAYKQTCTFIPWDIIHQKGMNS